MDEAKRRRIVAPNISGLNTPRLARSPRRELSLSPTRRSGSPVRRQHIAAIEDSARAKLHPPAPLHAPTSLDAGAPRHPPAALPRRVQFEPQIPADIDARLAALEAGLERRLQKFMDSVDKRLTALEKRQ